MPESGAGKGQVRTLDLGMHDAPQSDSQVVADQDLLERALRHWTEWQVQGGRAFDPNMSDPSEHGSLSAFAREVLVRSPRVVRRWREGLEQPLSPEVRAKLKKVLGIEEAA